jgi:TRAP-type mannitol/chloroaromatic compound transport system permease small subunit
VSYFRFIDMMSRAAARVAELLLVILVCAMLYEVFARYVLDAPTIWAFDVSYTATGAVFLLGAAWTTRVDGHVRVDFLSRHFPPMLRKTLGGGVYLLLVAPLFGALAWAAWKRTISAYVSGEVETVSIWAPLMWPFFAIIAIGLTLLSLQVALEGLRVLLDQIQDGDQQP